MTQKLPILILHTGIIDAKKIDAIGGSNFHTINLYQTLLQANINTTLLISTKPTPTKMEEAIKDYGLHYRTIFHAGPFKNRLLFKTYLIWKLIKICKEIGPCIVQCNNRREIWAAKIARLFVPMEIIFTYHTPQIISHRKIKGIIGALGSGHQTTAMLNAQNIRLKNSINFIDDLPMFYNQNKFLNYQATEDRTTFFRKHFGCTVPNHAPLLCMIANMYKDLNHKNHPLILRALADLNKHRAEKVHLVLAGGGPAEGVLKDLAKTLDIEHEVHFLGFSDQTPGILHHSDIFVLSSKEEAFGIVYLEAALMKKPLVGATKTGAENDVIIHEKTGLLFKNNDQEDLVFKLDRLIANPNLQATLGQNAYSHVRTNHSNESGLAKMLNFYEKIAAL